MGFRRFKNVSLVVSLEPYVPPDFEPVYWKGITVADKIRERIAAEKKCFPAVCPTASCWLEFFPEHICKYRLTTPRYIDKIDSAK